MFFFHSLRKRLFGFEYDTQMKGIILSILSVRRDSEVKFLFFSSFFCWVFTLHQQSVGHIATFLFFWWRRPWVPCIISGTQVEPPIFLKLKLDYAVSSHEESEVSFRDNVGGKKILAPLA
jgi:hypothetical protein